jgi:hypothetical protein
MKQICFILLSLILCSYKGYKKEDPCAKSELKGKIRSLTEVTEKQGDLYFYECKVYNYDKQGLLNSERDSAYIHNKNERLGSYSVSVTAYTYEKGRLIKTMTNPQGGRNMVTEYVYDKKGNLQTSVKYSLRDGVKDTMVVTQVTYSERRSVREVVYFNKRKEAGKEKQVYDEQGRMIESGVYDRKEGRFLITEKYGYDTEGNMLYKEVYDLYKESLQYTIKYQYAGVQLAGEVWDGMSPREIKYIYSEPDAKGNYLLKTIEQKPAPADVVRRSIVYY